MTGNLPFNPFEERVHLPLVRPKTRGEWPEDLRVRQFPKALGGSR